MISEDLRNLYELNDQEKNNVFLINCSFEDLVIFGILKSRI